MVNKSANCMGGCLFCLYHLWFFAKNPVIFPKMKKPP